MSVKIRCRDLLALEHPEFVDENVAGKCVGCPSSYGYTKDNPEWCMFEPIEHTHCCLCWDREIEIDDERAEKLGLIKEEK